MVQNLVLVQAQAQIQLQVTTLMVIHVNPHGMISVMALVIADGAGLLMIQQNGPHQMHIADASNELLKMP